MIKIEQALSNRFIKELIRSTVNGISMKDCYYDQLHYVNRKFVEIHKDYLTGIMLKALGGIHAGIASEDLIIVNDFVAPVNLANAQIHSHLKNNKYGWHVDGIDRFIGPCYNLWIPLYRQNALRKLDSRSIFDVIERKNAPALYAEDGCSRSYSLLDPMDMGLDERDFLCMFLGVENESLMNGIICPCKTGELRIVSREAVFSTSVFKPVLGDVFVFDSSQYHSSGPSEMERVGISIKFLMKNENLGFRKDLREVQKGGVPLGNWQDLFLGCYGQFKNFVEYKKFIDFFISKEKLVLHANQEKLNNISLVLKDIYEEV